MRTTYLVENIRFTTDLAENSLLFTSATSFTLKKRAPLSSSASSKHRLAAEPNMEGVKCKGSYWNGPAADTDPESESRDRIAGQAFNVVLSN